MSGKLTHRFEIFKRDKFTCQYCGKEPPAVLLELDHVIPVSQGGTDDDINLITSCFECNRGKGGKPLGFVKTGADVRKEVKSLKEKERQLKAYHKLRQETKRRENRELASLDRILSLQFPDTGLSETGKESFRRFLQIFPIERIQEAMHIARGKRLSTGDNMIKYTYGILHNWRRWPESHE